MDHLNLGNISFNENKLEVVSDKKIRYVIIDALKDLGIELSSDQRKRISDLAFDISNYRVEV